MNVWDELESVGARLTLPVVSAERDRLRKGAQDVVTLITDALNGPYIYSERIAREHELRRWRDILETALGHGTGS